MTKTINLDETWRDWVALTFECIIKPIASLAILLVMLASPFILAFGYSF